MYDYNLADNDDANGTLQPNNYQSRNKIHGFTATAIF